MNLLCLFAVVVTCVCCGDVDVSPAEASMRRIINLGHAIDDPDVQWLMKQTDLMLVIVSNPQWVNSLETRQNLINVIEHFVLATISGPRGIDIKEAAAVFERHRLHFHGEDLFDGKYSGGCLSHFALKLAFDLERYAPNLPTLLSDPDFPLDADQRVIFASLSSVVKRLSPQDSRFHRSFYMDPKTNRRHPTEYLEMLLDVYTKVEDEYTRLCQQSGVDVQYTYRPMLHLRRFMVDRKLALSEILSMIDDPPTIEFATRVGRCLDFALRHHAHPFASEFDSLVAIASRVVEDPEVICGQLMTRRFPKYPHLRAVPTPSAEITDANAPIPMEFADSRTIRVTRLVEVFAVRVPEIRDVFRSIDNAASMSKFERILWDELKQYSHQGARIERLAYGLTRFIGIRILHLPTIRERYFNYLSEEQFEGFRRIVSCMAHLAPMIGSEYVLDQGPYDAEIEIRPYILYALQHPDEIALMSRGLQALLRLYKQFQRDPISSVARHRTVVGFLPAYIVFGRSDFRFFSGMDRSRDHFHAQKFREGLEWVIGHECAFASPASLTRLVAGDLFRVEHPMGIVLEFLGGPFHEFDEMVFALDRMFREPVADSLYVPDYRVSWTMRTLGFAMPKRIFAAAMLLGGMGAIEAPMRDELLRIVPLFVEMMRAILNGQLDGGVPFGVATLQLVLDDPKQNDQIRLREIFDELKGEIRPPQDITL